MGRVENQESQGRWEAMDWLQETLGGVLVSDLTRDGAGKAIFEPLICLENATMMIMSNHLAAARQQRISSSLETDVPCASAMVGSRTNHRRQWQRLVLESKLISNKTYFGSHNWRRVYVASNAHTLLSKVIQSPRPNRAPGSRPEPANPLLLVSV